MCLKRHWIKRSYWKFHELINIFKIFLRIACANIRSKYFLNLYESYYCIYTVDLTAWWQRSCIIRLIQQISSKIWINTKNNKFRFIHRCFRYLTRITISYLFLSTWIKGNTSTNSFRCIEISFPVCTWVYRRWKISSVLFD